MSQIRGLRKIHGFGTDARLMRLLQVPYDALVAEAEFSAPSAAVFRRDMGIAHRCKAS